MKNLPFTKGNRGDKEASTATIGNTTTASQILSIVSFKHQSPSIRPDDRIHVGARVFIPAQ